MHTNAASVVPKLRLGPRSLVVEFAGNDGYLLQHVLPFGVEVLAIGPPADADATAHSHSLPTLVEDFGTALADKIVARGGRADLIVGNNVLERVPDLNDCVAGMKHLLAPEGVITVEFPHLQRLIAENRFDAICHERFSYFSLVAVDRLAELHGLKIIDVEKLESHGGSLRATLAHAASARSPSPGVNELLEHEIEAGLLDLETYARFSAQARRCRS